MTTESRSSAQGFDVRGAGVLLHITSLPGPGPCGSLGAQARAFIDFLSACGMGVWQMLPVGPTLSDRSPYQNSSTHAGDPLLIDLEPLVAAGWLPRLPDEDSIEAKTAALAQAWKGFQRRATDDERQALAAFTHENGYWLPDYALFRALRDERQAGWWLWPVTLRDRKSLALNRAHTRLAPQIQVIIFEQFLFFSQWQGLRTYAKARGIKLFGDMPIFVAQDSAEVWAHPQDFDLNLDGSPRVVAGVPPDYFSATGQRWGNPLYCWERMEAEGFRFWLDRVRTQLRLFDMIRIDHFRGFEAYWEIPATEEHAIHGQWVKALGDELFERLHQRFGKLPFIAEDLGYITPEVENLRRKYRYPGMKILQFAFSGGADNPYLPFRHDRDCVVYTGTHDNDTSLGWYHGLSLEDSALVDEFLGHPTEPMPWPLIRAALASRAYLAILPMQDLLALDGDHRMNVPGTAEGNWAWRFDWDWVPADLGARVRRMVEIYGR